MRANKLIIRLAKLLLEPRWWKDREKNIGSLLMQSAVAKEPAESKQETFIYMPVLKSNTVVVFLMRV